MVIYHSTSYLDTKIRSCHIPTPTMPETICGWLKRVFWKGLCGNKKCSCCLKKKQEYSHHPLKVNLNSSCACNGRCSKPHAQTSQQTSKPVAGTRYYFYISDRKTSPKIGKKELIRAVIKIKTNPCRIQAEPFLTSAPTIKSSCHTGLTASQREGKVNSNIGSKNRSGNRPVESTTKEASCESSSEFPTCMKRESKYPKSRKCPDNPVSCSCKKQRATTSTINTPDKSSDSYCDQALSDLLNKIQSIEKKIEFFETNHCQEQKVNDLETEDLLQN